MQGKHIPCSTILATTSSDRFQRAQIHVHVRSVPNHPHQESDLLIVKKREEPLNLLKLQALCRRTPMAHPNKTRIKKALAKCKSGYQGEQSIDYFLDFLPEESYFILHDLRFKHHKHYFQIDTLLLSQSFMVILEVKNMAGTLIFDQDFQQLIRVKDAQEQAFPDPCLQIQRQKLQMEEWFLKHEFPPLPLHTFIVISHPNAVIRTQPSNSRLSNLVIRRDYLQTKISQLEAKHEQKIATETELKKGIRLLRRHHKPADFCILDRFEMSEADLLKGVFCNQCDDLPIQKIHGKWYCPACHTKDKKAHIPALKDYALLINTNINNPEARRFLQIHDSAAMTRLFKSMDLPYLGENKSRVYSLKKLFK